MIKLTMVNGNPYFLDPFAIIGLQQIENADGRYTLVIVHGAEPEDVKEDAEAIAAVIAGAEELRDAGKAQKDRAFLDLCARLGEMAEEFYKKAMTPPPFPPGFGASHPLDEEPTLFPPGAEPPPDAPPPTEPPPLREGAANSGGFPL